MVIYKKYYTKNKGIIEVNTSDSKRGGEGEVFLKIKGKPLICAKILHINSRTPEKEKKVLFMIANPPVNIYNNLIICWPEEALYDAQNRFVGFTMKQAFPDSILLYELTKTQISVGHKWIAKYNRVNPKGIENRLKLCVNIAKALHTVHRSNKYVLVDLKPQNILITVDGKVAIIDLDSIQIANNTKVRFHAKVVTPEYTPKESEKLNPSTTYIPETWDRFSMAVIFYELIFGIHPYTATSKGQYAEISTINDKIIANLFVHGSKQNYLTIIPPPHVNYNRIPKSLKDLFLRSFETGSSNPLSRPAAEEWGATIYGELKKKIIDSVFTTSPNVNTQNSGEIVSNENLEDPISIPHPLPPPPKPLSKKNNPRVIILGLIIFAFFMYLVRDYNRHNNPRGGQEKGKIIEPKPTSPIVVPPWNEPITVNDPKPEKPKSPKTDIATPKIGEDITKKKVEKTIKTPSNPKYSPELNKLIEEARTGNIEDMFESGKVSYGVQDYQKAFQLFSQLADTHDYTEAQFCLGRMYEHGQGVPQDYDIALSWYKKAASKGHNVSKLRIDHIVRTLAGNDN